MAFTAVIGLAAGTTAATAVTVLAAVAEIGLAMTVVGAVTGSKSLMKAGAVMSMVGGIGGMVAGATSAAGGAVAAEAGTSAAAGGFEAGFTGTEALADGLSSAADLSGSVVDMTGAAVGNIGTDLAGQTLNTSMPDLSATLNSPGMASSGGANLSPVMPTDAAASTGLQAPLVTGAQEPLAVQGATAPGAAYTPYEDGFPASGVLSGGAPQSTSSFWENISGFAEKNKTMVNMGGQMVSGALNGMNQRQMWDQKMANEQAALAQKSYGNTTANWAPRGIIAGAQA